jgi:hypothetical protein
MGFKDWVRKHLGWFDRQIENYPSEANRPRPVPPAAPARRNPVGSTGPAVRRSPAAPPARAPRHRLEPDRRARRDDYDDIAAPGIGAAALESAEPRWIDESGHHDHRHHGHSAAAEHRVEDSGQSHHTTHHHGGGHDHSGSSGG